MYWLNKLEVIKKTNSLSYSLNPSTTSSTPALEALLCQLEELEDFVNEWFVRSCRIIVKARGRGKLRSFPNDHHVSFALAEIISSQDLIAEESDHLVSELVVQRFHGSVTVKGDADDIIEGFGKLSIPQEVFAEDKT